MTRIIPLKSKDAPSCHGNEVLRKEGMATACHSPGCKYAAVKKIGRNVITKGVEKPGVVGECL